MWRKCNYCSSKCPCFKYNRSSAQVDVFLVTAGDDVHLIRNAPVPAGSSLELISGSKVIMEANDILRVRAGTASALDVTVSYLEQT